MGPYIGLYSCSKTYHACGVITSAQEVSDPVYPTVLNELRDVSTCHWTTTGGMQDSSEQHSLEQHAHTIHVFLILCSPPSPGS